MRSFYDLLLRDATRERIHGEELRLQHLQSSLRHESRERLLRERTTIELAGRQLPERIEQLLTHARQRLDLAAEVVASHSPQQLLRLGFAIVRSEGRALKRVEEIDQADQITIEVSDGIREVRPEKYNHSK